MGRALAPDEWKTLVKMAEALLQGSPVVIPPEDVADNVEQFLLTGRSRRAWRVRALLALIEYYPVAFYGERTSRMSLETRRRMISERYERGEGVWYLCSKVRVLVNLGAYGDPRSHAATGYVRFARRKRAPATQPEAAA